MDFIIHIGMGKTGSTSIQNHLEENISFYESKKVRYLGLILENFQGNSKLSWQKKSYAHAISDILNNESLKCEFRNLLQQALDKAKIEGLEKVILSNEGLGESLTIFCQLLEEINLDGVRVKFIAYIRNPLDWSLSAYSQWGIKHKTYTGEVQSYLSYFNSRNIDFANQLEPLKKLQHESIYVNYDEVSDTVQDFLARCKIQINFDLFESNSKKDNVKPSKAELFYRAVFNTRRNETTLPSVFDNYLNIENINFEWDPIAWFNQLQPSKSGLNMVYDKNKIFFNELNMLLKNQNEQQFEYKNFEKLISEDHLSIEKITGVLIQIILNQNAKLIELEKRLEKKITND